MSKTVIALFDNPGNARRAVDALKTRGFVNEHIQVQSGEDFIRQGNVPPVAKPQEGLYSGIKYFFQEIGLTSPDGPRPGEHHPVAPDDAVVLLETSDDRADEAADILDDEGAVDVEERRERRPQRPERLAGGLEAKTSGKTPPSNEPDPEEVREQKTHARRTRIYGPWNEPYGDDWAPRGPRAH